MLKTCCFLPPESSSTDTDEERRRDVVQTRRFRAKVTPAIVPSPAPKVARLDNYEADEENESEPDGNESRKICTNVSVRV